MPPSSWDPEPEVTWVPFFADSGWFSYFRAMHAMRSSVLSILLLPISGIAQMPTIDWDPVQDCNISGQGALRPRITTIPSGDAVVLWGSSGPAGNWVAIGGSAGFSSPIELSGPGVVPSVADWMGSSVASVGNTVWVVMKTEPEESSPIYARRSDDGGWTWGDTVRVDPPDGLVSRFPSIAVVDPDRPIVQYMQFDFGWSGARQAVTHMQGGAFMPPVPVSTPFTGGEVCDCCPNQVLARNDEVVALYRNAFNNERVMWGARSNDQAVTFPLGAMLDTTGWILNACPSSGPSGYMFGDSLRYVWMSGAANGTKVYVGTAAVSDLSIGDHRLVHPGQALNQSQNFPRIAGSGDTLGVVWEQFEAGARDIYFSWSVSGPGGLSVPERVNIDMAGSQRTPDLAYANGAFHIIWSEMGSDQARYRRGVLSTATAVQEQDQLAALALADLGGGRYQLLNGPWTRVQVVDVHGRSVVDHRLSNDRMDLSALTTGLYLIRAEASDGRWARAKVYNH